jgi:cytochrome P450
MKDFTFSDGTLLPAGTFVCVPLYATHHAESLGDDAYTFNPFRFSAMREREGEISKHQMVTPGLDYVPWGHGKHAW